MDAPENPVWFVGDFDDPWVSAIAEAVPRAVRIPCPGNLPDDLQLSNEPPAGLVLHRPLLTPRDAERVAKFRAAHGPTPRIVLCIGPHVRYAEVERWLGLVDVVLPEATASETIARHFEPAAPPRPDAPRPRVRIVSDNFELRQALREACTWAGYPADAARDWSEPGEWGLAIWDVPVLEPGWPRTLADRAADRPVVALLGLADRTTVTEARTRGAAACLELTFELPDLVRVLDRLSRHKPRAEPAHRLPPPPASARQAGRTVAGLPPDA